MLFDLETISLRSQPKIKAIEKRLNTKSQAQKCPPRNCNTELCPWLLYYYQRYIVHQVCNTLKFVSDKDRKAFVTDLKKTYNAPPEKDGREALDKVK